MHLLVTGGAGFIGSNFIKYILEETDWQVTNLDKLTYAGNLENLADIQDNTHYKFVRGDIADNQAVNNLFSGNKFTAVVNFAAESHVDRSIQDASPFINANIAGTQVLLDASLKYKIDRFLQVSTDEVYGSLEDDGFFTEDTTLAPNSPYSASKASADLLCRAYYKTHGLPVLITRCSNNFGPYQFPEKLIPLVVSNAIEDKPIPVYGSGINIRDWIYVLDHCAGIKCVLERGVPGEVYNIGGDTQIHNIELIKMILSVVNKSDSLITYVKDRPGHDHRYAIDPQKIKSQLGWNLQYNFKSALIKTVKWYIDNQDWWNKVKSGEYINYYQKWYGIIK
ncbi:MAG: spore coat protein [Peptococcaceae bacterium BRH_c4b]|nr:MAG: spore coat protein [Peptococcaceae bacterium BRH_c4b]